MQGGLLKNKYFILAIIASIFLFFRLYMVCSFIQKNYSLNELYLGTTAKEIIAGPVLSVFDYLSDKPHRGGRLVITILAVSLYSLFGESYFVLKLVGIFFSLGILILMFLFLWKFFDENAAVIASLIMIFSPALYTKVSFLVFGAHYESIAFSLAAIFIFYQIFFQKIPFSDSPRNQSDSYADKNIYFAAFGIVSGLGVFFHHIFVITLTACFLFWFIFDKLFFVRKSFFIFLIFFVIGLSPLIYYNMTDNFAGLRRVYSNHLLECPIFLNPKRIALYNLRNLLTHILPNSFSPDASVGRVISYAYYGLFVISYGVLFWLNRRIIAKLLLGIIPLRNLRISASQVQRESFLLLYPLVFILVFTLFGYSFTMGVIDHQYLQYYMKLIPLYPFIFIILSLFLSRLWGFRKWGGRVTVAIFFILFLFLIANGIAGHYNVGMGFNFRNCLSYEGYAYDKPGSTIWDIYGDNPEKAIALAHKFARPYRPFVFGGIGWGISYWFFHDKKYRDMQECNRIIGMIDERYRPYALAGFVACRMHYNPGLGRIIALIDQFDGKYRPQLYRGVGWFCGMAFKEHIDKSIAMISRVSEKYQSECYRGLGTVIGRIFGDIPYCARLLNNIPPEHQCAAFEGLAEHLGWRYEYHLKKDPFSLIKDIPVGHQACFKKGLHTFVAKAAPLL